MNGQGDKNLKELFEESLGPDRADEAVEDVRKGEQILRKYPVPGPDNKLLTAIKLKIAGVLLLRKARFIKRIAYKAAAVAAVFIILAVICIKYFGKEETQQEKTEYATAMPTIPVETWESEDIAAVDAELTILIAEIEQVEREMLTLQLGENGDNGSEAIAELEMEFIEINNNFWKG